MWCKGNPHQLRKFFIIAMKLPGVPELLVEYWCGHALPSAKDPISFRLLRNRKKPT